MPHTSKPRSKRLKRIRRGRGPSLPASSRNFIRAWRDMAGLTQEQLSQKSGISRSVVSRLEAGTMAYREDLLFMLGKAFDAAPWELLAFDPSNPAVSAAAIARRLFELQATYS